MESCKYGNHSKHTMDRPKMHVVQDVCFRNLLLAQGKVHITQKIIDVFLKGLHIFTVCVSTIFGTFSKMWAKEVSGFLEATMATRPI